MEYLLKNIIILETNFKVELTIAIIVMILLVLSIICLTIVKKAKEKK